MNSTYLSLSEDIQYTLRPKQWQNGIYDRAKTMSCECSSTKEDDDLSQRTSVGTDVSYQDELYHITCTKFSSIFINESNFSQFKSHLRSKCVM